MPRRSCGQRRLALPHSLIATALAAALAGCERAPTVPADGRLLVAISGLPLDVGAMVTVTGPEGASFAVEESSVLSELRPGTYIITALDVTAGTHRYAPTPATQTIAVAAAGLVTAGAIRYSVATALLDVSVLGLPAGAASNVAVTGPGGFARTVGGSATLDGLLPGTYTIVANDVSANGRTFHAEQATQSLELVPSTAPRVVTVAYGAGTASLDVSVAGLPGGTSAAISVTGPGSFTRTLTGPSTLRFLDPGSYTLTAGVVGSDLTTYTPAVVSQSIAVADNSVSAATVTYQGAALALRVTQVVDGLTAPTFLTAPPGDERLFVVERNGRIQIVANGSLLGAPFLDITARVNFVGERGMLGMAFDPGYASNGRFFVYYVDLSGDVVVERFSSTPGSNVAGASDGIVITMFHRGNEHHGGMMEFGADGMLYLAPGDGRCCGDPDNNAQNMFSPLGKVLRIDVRSLPYDVPVTNPFVGRGWRDEIWASGLRHAWRFSFDTVAQLLYVADVGQDAREEINVVPANAAGLNFGWRFMEGTSCFLPATNCSAGLTLEPPAHEYTHADGCSVIGGYVYRGSAIPELTGHYLYADYCRGWLRSFRGTAAGASDHRAWGTVSLPGTVSFGQDGAGELYMIAGPRVWRIVRN